MRNIYLHIILALGILVPSLGFAQLYVSEGTVISNPQNIVVKDSSVKDSVQQPIVKGKIFVSSGNEGIISVDANTINNLEIVTVSKGDDSELKDEHSTKTEVKKQTPEKGQEEQIAVHYINVEGISFVQPEKEEPQIITENKREYGGGVIVTSNTFLQGIHSIRYSIPILYNYTFKERFSDYAKLYKFEYLTAIFHPPTV